MGSRETPFWTSLLGLTGFCGSESSLMRVTASSKVTLVPKTDIFGLLVGKSLKKRSYSVISKPKRIILNFNEKEKDNGENSEGEGAVWPRSSNQEPSSC